jgi:hypothetical protein
MMNPLKYSLVDLSIDEFGGGLATLSHNCPKQAYKQLYVAEFQLLFFLNNMNFKGPKMHEF